MARPPRCAGSASARSGCYPLTGAVESAAASVAEIILELLQSRHSERQGRAIDSDQIGSMEKKKQEGYF